MAPIRANGTVEKNIVRRLLKASAFTLLITLSVLTGCLGYYDVTFFQPALSNTKQLIGPASSQITPLLKRHLQIAYDDTLQFHAAKVLLRQSQFGGGDGLRLYLWGTLADLHLSKEETLSIVASLAYMGSNHYGFSSASQAIYAKPIEQLSSVESATLVALMYAPSYYEGKPEKLTERRDQILNKASNPAF